MQRTLSVLAISAALSTLGLAENWSGKLLDASCYNQHKKVEACDATAKTTSFALEVAGAVYQLDQAGNSKALAALKNRADRTDPNQTQPTQVMAKVDGTEKDGTISVQNIEVQ